ncbi:MAG: RluA family pseudouridine synthase [Planctomycetota bacterium]
MAGGDGLVKDEESGWSLARWLETRHGLGPRRARELIARNKITIDETVCAESGRRLIPGQKIVVLPETAASPQRPPRPKGPVSPNPEATRGALRLLHLDDDIVVVDKPANITTHRNTAELAERKERERKYLPPTLFDLLRRQLSDGPGSPMPRLWPLHRLDNETSGVVVFALNPDAATFLARQFREHTIGRRYWGLTRGIAQPGRIATHLVPERGDGRRGSGEEGPDSRHAITHVRLVQAFDGFSWVECRLETGRTHQIRIHLGEAGTPLCGEKVYDRPLHGAPLPDASGAPRIALHARDLELTHPRDGKRIAWRSPWPQDLHRLANYLARQAHVALAEEN